MLNLPDIQAYFNFLFAAKPKTLTSAVSALTQAKIAEKSGSSKVSPAIENSESTEPSMTKLTLITDGFIAYGWEDTITKSFIPHWKTGICKASMVQNQYETILKEFPNALPNLHITLNETALNPIDGSFRSRKSIKSSRVLCVDLDTDTSEAQIAELAQVFKPGMIVESSPSRYHLYWKLQPGGISIATPKTPRDSKTLDGQSLPPWTMYQLAFAAKLGGDLARSDISSTIRVPGFPRVTKAGLSFTPRLVGLSPNPRAWTEHELVIEFPWIAEASRQGLTQLQDSRKSAAALAKQRAREIKEIITRGRSAEFAEQLDLPETYAGVAGRNTTIYNYISELAYQTGLEEQFALDEALTINKGFNIPLDESECLEAARNGWNHGFAAHEARREKMLAVIEPLSQIDSPKELTQIATVSLPFTATVEGCSIIPVVKTTLNNPTNEPTVAYNFKDGNPVILQKDRLYEINLIDDETVELVEFGKSVSAESNLTPKEIHLTAVASTDISHPEVLNGGWVQRDGSIPAVNLIFETPELTSQDINSAVHIPAIDPASPKTHTNGHAFESKETNQNEITNTETEQTREQTNHNAPIAKDLTAKSKRSLTTKAKFSTKENLTQKKKELPKDVEAAAMHMAQVLWANRPESIKTLIHALDTKSTQQLAELMCNYFNDIGMFTTSGLKISLRGETEWGSEVTYLQLLTRDQLPSFAHRTLKLFSNEILSNEETKGALKNPLTDRNLQDITRSFINHTFIKQHIARQPKNLIVFQNGYFDIKTGLFTHDQDAPIKFSNPIMANYDVNLTKEPEKFKEYMQQWFPGDADIYEWMLRWFGYCMTTDNDRQLFSYFYGPARAGKGSIARILCRLVGEQNYTSLNYKGLTEDFLFASAAEKLVISIEEVQGTEKEHEIRLGHLKRILGGERVMINPKYKTPYEDYIIGKVIMQSNETLSYQDKGHSLRSRMMSVGFEQSFEHTAHLNPALAVLVADADILASCAARAYCAACHEDKWGDVFKFPESQAIRVGTEAVTDNLSLDSLICKNYLMVERNKSLSGNALKELFTLVSDNKTSLPSNKRIAQFYTEVFSMFIAEGITKSDRVSSGDEKRVRGFKHLTINKEALLRDFEELTENAAVNQTIYPHLYEALGMSLTDDATKLL